MNFELCACGQPVYSGHLCLECFKHRAAIPGLSAGPDPLEIANARIQDLTDALVHLLEVQTAPSFDKPHDRDEKAVKLYKLQVSEWQDATSDARRAVRRG